ncbi:MAG: hypothetical protein RLY40_1227 [Pseudomonadota bacterium]|jgi:hypothetical protein
MKIPFTNIEIFNIFKKSKKLIETPEKSTSTIEMPVVGGRQTIPEGNSFISLLYQEMSVLQPDFEIELLNVLERLVKYNPDVSYALDNIVQLGNTPYTVFLGSKTSLEETSKIVAHLEEKSKLWYSNSNGLNSLINDLLSQCVMCGTISTEIIPKEDLSGVKKCVLVSPKNIRFKYDKAKDDYIPHQLVKGAILPNMTIDGMLPLSTSTYKYMTLRRFNESPYGIPPFLSALENISIERNMLNNLIHITKQLGVFGFLQVLIRAPQRRAMNNVHTGELAETDEQYQERVRKYLINQSKEVEKSLATGFIVGTQEGHQFDMKGNLANPTGTKQIFDLNTEMKLSGLKQDSLMLGRNYSTTETIARVILTKLGAQVANYQKVIASLLEDLFLLELRMSGFNINTLKVEFEKPLIGDELKDQNAYGKKIENLNNLYIQGVISQEQRSQALGYEKPALPKPMQIDISTTSNTPPSTEDPKKTSPDNTETKKDATGKNSSESIQALLLSLRSDVEEFDYSFDHNCGHIHSFEDESDSDFGDELVNDFFRQYYFETVAQYEQAINKSIKTIGQELAKLTQGATVERVTDSIIYHLYSNWNTNFTIGQKKIIEKWVTNAYQKFRNDTKPFGDVVNAPAKAIFNLTDYRTINYFKNSDDLYLSKFITDADTRKKMLAFIKENYIEGNLPLGQNSEAIKLFTEKFGNLLKGEEHKIFRIISTTVNKLKNYAAVNYLNQGDVKTFSIVGINDQLQCKYCSLMQGKQFSVSVWNDKVNEFVSGDPAFVKGASPFITSVFKGSEGLNTLSNADSNTIQSLGIGLPPFHPRCRDQIIAIL